LKTLITAWEVIKFGPVQKEYPTAYVCNHIKRTERLCFSKCYLGLEFYNKLLSALNKLSGDEYDVTKVYAIEDRICYEGCILKSTIENNTTHPEDDSESYWITVDKFKNECFQELWECHLRYFLSLKVLYTSIRYSTYQAGAKGLVKHFSDATGVQTVDDKAFNAYKKELNKDAQDELELMFDWMVEKQKEGKCDFGIKDVSDACGCEDNSCLPPKKRRKRRFYFKK